MDEPETSKRANDPKISSKSRTNLASVDLASFEERLMSQRQKTLNFSRLQKIDVKKFLSEVFDTESLKF